MPDDKPIPISPISGWDLATLPGANVMLNLRFLVQSEARPARLLEQAHRFGITAAQCRELAEALLRKAELAEARRDGRIQ